MPEQVRPKTIAVEELFNEYADAATLREGTRPTTVPTDGYILQAKSFEGRENANDGRRSVRIRANIIKEDARIGTVWFNASWQVRRTGVGKLDRDSRTWSQLAMAVFPSIVESEVADKSVGEVLDMVMKFPINAYVTEAFRTGEDATGKPTCCPQPDDE